MADYAKEQGCADYLMSKIRRYDRFSHERYRMVRDYIDVLERRKPKDIELMPANIELYESGKLVALTLVVEDLNEIIKEMENQE